MRLKNIIVLVTGLLGVVGCSEFLDENMQGTYSSGTFYKTEEHALLAVNACYEPLAFKSIKNCLWVFGDVASDDATKGGNPGDQSEISFIDNFEITADNGYIESIWQHYYEGIARTNKVIANVPSISMEEGLKKQYVAEAKFLRAFYYFNLVNIFGEIPLKTVPPETTEDLHVAVSSVDEVYTQIEMDLTEAAEDLKEEITASEYGRATKGAALGLLAKAFLYQQEWQKALTAIEDLENLEIYSLMEVYKQNFMVDYENNSESVFEIQHLTGQVPFSGNAMNQWFAPQPENGYFFDTPVQDFVDEFETANVDTVVDTVWDEID